MVLDFKAFWILFQHWNSKILLFSLIIVPSAFWLFFVEKQIFHQVHHTIRDKNLQNRFSINYALEIPSKLTSLLIALQPKNLFFSWQTKLVVMLNQPKHWKRISKYPGYCHPSLSSTHKKLTYLVLKIR